MIEPDLNPPDPPEPPVDHDPDERFPYPDEPTEAELDHGAWIAEANLRDRLFDPPGI